MGGGTAEPALRPWDIGRVGYAPLVECGGEGERQMLSLLFLLPPVSDERADPAPLQVQHSGEVLHTFPGNTVALTPLMGHR